MRKARLAGGLLASILTACSPAQDDTSLPLSEIKSGSEFLTQATQMQQDDTFLNPGFLWVEQGEILFQQGPKPCADCHDPDAPDFAMTALSYPKIDAKSQSLTNLEGRINLCRARHQNLSPLPYDHDDLLALTSYLSHLSNGERIDYEVTDDLKPYAEAGARYFMTRRGQLNLSCHQCHDQNWGKQLRGDIISQGHINGFPTYRNDWEDLGSTHRRFADCDRGVRAEPRSLGHADYLALEVYLKARGAGLTNEAPSLRR